MTAPLADDRTSVSAADFPGIRWHGNWIWCDPPPSPNAEMVISAPARSLPEAHALFRKRFTLAGAPERAPARVTADSRYLLYCNGQEVSRGPIRSQPRRMVYDLFDLAPYLKAGENILAIYVKYYGSANAFWMPAPGGFGAIHGPQMVFEAKLGPAWLVTDATWKAHKSTAWAEDWRGGRKLSILQEVVPLEVFDARQFPAGWERPGFDDSAWGDAFVISGASFTGPIPSQPPTHPYGPLHPRPIARLSGERRDPESVALQMLRGRVDLAEGDPVRRLDASFQLETMGAPQPGDLPTSVTLGQDASARITLDMGRIVIGQAAFALQAPAGAILDFSYTEAPLDPSNGFRFSDMHSGARYYARGVDDVFSTYDALGFRYASILVHGATGKVAITDFAVQEEIYPWQPGPAFRCADEELNRIFAAGIRTVNLNARDAFTDCPTREQQAWVGDSVVHQMVSLATNTDWRLAWHYLTLADSPRSDGILPPTVSGLVETLNDITIPDWSLHWVHGVYNLYRFSGDREKVLAFMPSIARVLRWFAPFQNEHGVLEHMIEWALIDWSAVSVDGESAIYTAIWARGLAEFAEMAAWLGEHASRAWAENLYARAKAGFEMFWDEGRGSYVDHVVEGERRPEMSQLAGALAIVSGLAPRGRWPAIVRAITDRDRLVIRTWMQEGDEADGPVMNQGRFTWDVQRQIVRAEPFMSYVVHDAIAEAGQADLLVDLYRDWSRFLQNGYDTIGEDWTHGSHAHGWSCTPTRDLIFYTLGLTPAEPGYATVRIAPRLGGLAWIEASVPTPHGLIWVRAEPGQVEFDSPAPVLVELAGRQPERLPAGRHRVSA